MQLWDLSGEPVVFVVSGQRDGERDGGERMWLDGVEQCELDHGDVGVEWYGERGGLLLGGAEYGGFIEDGDVDDRGPDAHGESGGSGLQLFDLTND